MPADQIMDEPDEPRDAADENRRVFDYLRRRAAFVRNHTDVEALVVWGAVVEAVGRIDVQRRGGQIGASGPTFKSALGLASSLDAAVIAMPILVEELHRLPAGHDGRRLVRNSPPLVECKRAMDKGRIWTAEEDARNRIVASNVSTNLSLSREERRTSYARCCSYADILYRAYRCSLVHGLDLGWETWSSNDARDRRMKPIYMNYEGNESGRPLRRRYRTRIAFGKPLLAQLLDEMIDREE